ncbi:MAG: leucine-rich repeat protein, partial [Butyrivibrio sp.]|nr:leucine-rich repeat protein [Butyrivibrio sp.]
GEVEVEASEMEQPRYALKNNASTGFHYTKLTDDEKVLYNALYLAITSKKYIPYSDRYITSSNSKYDSLIEQYKYLYHTGSSSFYNSSTFDNMYSRAKQACVFDHPDMIELYMCYPREIFTSYSVTGSGTVYNDYMVFVAYYDDAAFATLDNQIKVGLNKYMAEISAKGLVKDDDNDDDNDAVTELNVHDNYAAGIVYDYDCARLRDDPGYFHLSHTAWGSLYKKYCVCDGYSLGFLLVMDRLGIDTAIITGEGDGGNHAWNIVKLGNNWYEVDTTWAHQDYGLIHTFFNKTTSDYASYPDGAHVRQENSAHLGISMPVATGTKYTYDYITENFGGDVIPCNYVMATAISLPQTQLELQVGDVYTITPTFVPSNTTMKGFNLESSNTSVAGVVRDLVVIKNAGVATIYVRSLDASNVYTTCQITVKESQKQEDTETKETSYKGTSDKNASSCTIPSTITDENGVNYEVVEISDNAFKGRKKLKKVTIPATIKVIGKNAFKNCKNLKTININATSLTKVKSGAFKGIKENAKITISAPSRKVYNKVVKMFKKAGAKTQKYKFKKTK